MSGIAGIFATDRSDDLAERSRAMSNRLPHRGEVTGMTGDDGRVAISTRHHSSGIYRAGALLDHERAVIFDGVLANAEEILRLTGGADILDAIWLGFQRDGESFLARLDGSFAIVIQDRQTNRFSFVRDRFGHRPLLFAVVDGGVLVASEYQAFQADPAYRPRVDEEVLVDVLRLGLVLGPQSLVNNVYKALPGQVLTLDHGGVVTRSLYFRPAIQPAKRQNLDEVERFVEEHLVSRIQDYPKDVRLGLLLSGGIDSALLAHYLQKESHRPHGASFGASNWADEESAAAEAVAERVGLPFTRVLVDDDFDVLGHLARAVWHIGEPTRFDNAIALECTYAALAPHTDAVLTGELADSFLGESEHRRARWLPLLWRIPARLRNTMSAAPDSPSLGRAERIAGHLRSETFGDYLRGSFAWAPGLAAGPGPTQSVAALAAIENSFHVGSVARFTLTNLLGFWFPWIERMEQTGAAHGLDVAHPFETNAMLDFALAMPYRNKVRRLGRLTKPALRNLAAETFGGPFAHQAKKKLRAPMSLWLNTSPRLREAVLDLRHGDGMWRDYVAADRAEPYLTDYERNGADKKTTARAVFLLLSLEIWLHQTLAGEIPPPDSR